jgi:hypothetical protein
MWLLIGAVVLAVVLWLLSRLRPSAAKLQAVGFWLLTLLLIAIVAISTWRITQELRPSDLLTTFPLVLLLLVSWPSHPRPAGAAARFLFMAAIAFVGLVVIVSPFEGGIQWGPRFLLPAIVPLAVVIVARLDRVWGAIGRGQRVGVVVLFSVCLLAGGYSTWRGLDFMHQNQVASEFMSAVIQQSSERVVVADSWFLPQNAPYAFAGKIWLLAEADKPMFDLIQLLRKTTYEPGMIYVSALTWAHIDPGPLLGPRIKETGERVYVGSPEQYIEVSHYLLLK